MIFVLYNIIYIYHFTNVFPMVMLDLHLRFFCTKLEHDKSRMEATNLLKKVMKIVFVGRIRNVIRNVRNIYESMRNPSTPCAIGVRQRHYMCDIVHFILCDDVNRRTLS